MLLTLAQIADHVGGVLRGNAQHAIFSFASLNRATSGDICYFDNIVHQHLLASTSAGVVLLRQEHASWCKVDCIIVLNPHHAMLEIIKLLSFNKHSYKEIHDTAFIHSSAQLGIDISIGPNTVIGARAQIDNEVVIGANVVIERDVHVGRNCHIGHGVVLHSGTYLGEHVSIDSGAVIGASPFNHEKNHGYWQSGPAVGGVFIECNVIIGANTIVDRGTLSDTYLAAGVCIDHLVLVAHDVVIGANTAIAGCAAIGSHAQLGADCIIGGGACIASSVKLEDGVVITGMSGVSKSLSKEGIYSSGTIIQDHKTWRKNAARFRRLDDYIAKLNCSQEINNYKNR